MGSRPDIFDSFKKIVFRKRFIIFYGIALILAVQCFQFKKINGEFASITSQLKEINLELHAVSKKLDLLSNDSIQKSDPRIDSIMLDFKQDILKEITLLKGNLLKGDESPSMGGRLAKIDRDLITIITKLDQFSEDSLQTLALPIDSLLLDYKEYVHYEFKQLKEEIANDTLGTIYVSGDLISEFIQKEKAGFGFYIIRILLIFGLLLMGVGLISKEKREKIIASGVATIALSIGLSIGFETEFSLDPEFKFEFNKCDCSGTKENIRIDSVGPFKSGTIILENEGLVKLKNIKENFSQPNWRFSEITIYGGVDRRQLKGKTFQSYGDNLSLAQARANYIKDYLLDSVLVSEKGILFNIGVNGDNTNTLGYDSISSATSRMVKIVGRYVEIKTNSTN
ncbi:hypothetical protein V1387_04895 [Allomuricauda taeanensis]|nr:hypothetical protein [Allomuricauda taeanensis]